MGEGNHAFRFSEAEGMRIGTVVMSVVASLAIVAVLANRAIPDGVVGLELLTKVTAVREWEGTCGPAGGCFFVVILGHGEPAEAVVVGVFYGCG